MDAQGIDVEALSINPYWYRAERDLAEQLIRIQNEKLAEVCAANPDRFVGFASVALQFPDLAIHQLEDGVRKCGLRGAAIGGNVNGEEISDPKFHPFWAKAEQLGVRVFIHADIVGASNLLADRLKGNGYLDNVLGFPMETSIALSHLIFEGTLDKFPGLKISAGRTAAASFPHTPDAPTRSAAPARMPAPVARTGRSGRPLPLISSRCNTARWCSRKKACVTSPRKSEQAS